MGLLDRLSGGKAAEARQQQEADAAAAAAAAASAPSTSAGMLDGVPPGLSFPDSIGGHQPQRLYNPYEGLSQSVGVKSQTFKLPDRPEFVFEEEAAARRRGWTEHLQFYTGLGYVAGGGTGFTIGAFKVLTTPAPVANATLRLRANRWLNAAGSNAKPLGNGCAILGLYFAITESVMLNQLDQHLPDSAITMLAGATTGSIFRLPRGPRQATVAGALGGLAGAALVALRSLYPSA